MARTNVGILRGGTSNEYSLSLKTGAAMLTSLPQETYDARDILVDKNGMWYRQGIPSDPARALAQVDVVLNALHGGVGEDGSVQRILDQIGVPYTGSRPLPAGFSLNKFYTRELARKAGVRVAQGLMFKTSQPLDAGEMARAVFARFGPPYIVKPVNQGSSHGVAYVATIVQLPEAIADVLDAFGAAIVEEYVRGHDASVGVIENFRGQDLYALPPVHTIAPDGQRFVSFASHEKGEATHIAPSSFSQSDKEMLEESARMVHNALGLSHFSHSDFRLTPKGPVLLEVNAIPALYPGAAFPKALEAVGSSVREFAEHAISLAKG